MNKFKVDEICIIVEASGYPQIIGSECSIVSIDDKDEYGKYEIDIQGHSFKSLGAANFLWAAEGDLKKIPPKDEPTTWEECIFQPAGITV